MIPTDTPVPTSTPVPLDPQDLSTIVASTTTILDGLMFYVLTAFILFAASYMAVRIIRTNGGDQVALGGDTITGVVGGGSVALGEFERELVDAESKQESYNLINAAYMRGLFDEDYYDMYWEMVTLDDSFVSSEDEEIEELRGLLSGGYITEDEYLTALGDVQSRYYSG